jgi:hypothetical protein
MIAENQRYDAQTFTAVVDLVQIDRKEILNNFKLALKTHEY